MLRRHKVTGAVGEDPNTRPLPYALLTPIRFLGEKADWEGEMTVGVIQRVNFTYTPITSLSPQESLQPPSALSLLGLSGNFIIILKSEQKPLNYMLSRMVKMEKK